jgi:hypothetical protein
MPQCQFMFSAVFVFQKNYTGNILGIGRNEARSFYFPRHETESKEETEEGQEVATHPSGAGPPLAAPPCGVGPPWCPLTLPLHLYKASDVETLKKSAFSQIKFRSAAVVEDQFWGTEVFVLAPCRDGELPPESSPSTPSTPPPYPSTPPPSPSTLLSPMMRREYFSPGAEGSTGSYVVHLSLP